MCQYSVQTCIIEPAIEINMPVQYSKNGRWRRAGGICMVVSCISLIAVSFQLSAVSFLRTVFRCRL